VVAKSELSAALPENALKRFDERHQEAVNAMAIAS
jgi:hypothetical protein